MNIKLTFEEKLQDHFLAYQLLKRKLRISLVNQYVKNIDPKGLRKLHSAIHSGKKPSPGSYPAIQTIPQSKESYLYIGVFASIYRTVCNKSITTDIDLDALIFSWDFFCEAFPGQIRERRPFGKIHPANFTEAWIFVEALKNGSAELKYCEKCHGDFIVIYGSKYPPTCQICVLDSQRQ